VSLCFPNLGSAFVASDNAARPSASVEACLSAWATWLNFTASRSIIGSESWNKDRNVEDLTESEVRSWHLA
jgi:hypothetical protein